MSYSSRIVWFIVTFVMIGVNALAVSLPLNEVSTGQLSDQLTTLITPAGFTFGIWSVIYLGLCVITGLVAWGEINLSKQITWSYIIGSLANAGWIVTWHYGYLTRAMLIIVILLGSLIVIDQHIMRHEVDHFISRVRGIFLVYFGWVQIATLLMTTIYLIYGLGWITADTLRRPILVLVLATMTNAWVLWKTRRIETSLVFVRALIGIYMGQSDPTIQATVMTVGGIMLVMLAYHFYGQNKVNNSKPLEL